MLISHAFCSLAYGLIPSQASAVLDGASCFSYYCYYQSIILISLPASVVKGYQKVDHRFSETGGILKYI
jgi:hypothetical protein